jgi:hypothetical protein
VIASVAAQIAQSLRRSRKRTLRVRPLSPSKRNIAPAKLPALNCTGCKFYFAHICFGYNFLSTNPISINFFLSERRDVGKPIHTKMLLKWCGLDTKIKF